MIRAWTILEPKAKNPKPIAGARHFVYPTFPTLKEARDYRRTTAPKTRIVRCQIRVEGSK